MAAKSRQYRIEELLRGFNHSETVVPSDATDLLVISENIFVGGAGTITAIMADGTTQLFTGVAAGSIMPIRASRIKTTGTSATDMVSLS